jgi:hypothetical protein
VFLSTAPAADDEPEGVTKFKATVEAQGKVILKAAHPLGKFKQICCDGYARKCGKHELTYTVTWAGKEQKQAKEFATTLTLTFALDAAGKVADLEVAVAKDTSPAKPFRAAELAAGVFRAQVKNLVTAVIDDKDLLAKVDKMDADGLLAVWLQFVDRKPKKP